MLTSTALVLFMTIPGLALFYGGMVRKKNVIATVAQSFAITCLVTALSAIAAWSAPETYRTPIDQLGKADAVSLDKPTYDALRANALTGNQP